MSNNSENIHSHLYFERLKRRLRWTLFSVYAAPLLVLAVFFHYQYGVTLREGIYNHLKSAAEHQRNIVDLFLRERVANLKRAFRAAWLKKLPDEEHMQRTLELLDQESATFSELGLFDPSGRLVAYAGPYKQLLGKDYSDEEWLKHLREEGRDHYISDVYLGFRGKPHFIVAVSYKHHGDLWTLRTSVDPEQFGNFVASSYLFRDAEAFVLNSRGQRQTFSGKGSPPAEEMSLPERKENTEVEEVSLGGRKYLRALAWLTETNWVLAVQVPAEKALEPMKRARLWLSAIMLATLLVIVFFVRRGTRVLVGRLERLDKSREELRLQLFSAAKLASVGEMAAGVAHEINNPLAIIYEEASMMKDILNPEFGQNFAPAEFSERLDAIIAATLRGRSITSKLLAFARRHDPDPQPSDLNLLLDRVLEVKAVDFKTANIEVRRDYQPDLPWVMVNRNQMDQVILNLLNNARDAMENGGLITVRTRREGDWVRVDVEDTGKGMPPEVLEKIFMPFFTTKKVGKGTGLGLSISYGIIEAAGGRIQVNSQVGKGSCFSIFLPVKPEAQVKAKNAVQGGQHV